MAASECQKDKRFSAPSETVMQDMDSSEDVLDSDSDNEEIVSMKLLYHSYISEKCACKIEKM